MAENEIAPLPIGARLYEYRIDKVLGQGGFGITYLGKNLKTNETIVIKENIPGRDAYRRHGSNSFKQQEGAAKSGPGSAEWARANFIREASALAGMHHPGVVSVLESFESQVTQTQYYIMPYMGSESLGHAQASGLAPTYSWVHYMLCALLHTLSYVHQRGMLHRDIKPDNILVCPSGQPVLIDFGSARNVDTNNKTRLVTEDYSPIEQVRGEGEGEWTDIYALGATFYHILTGSCVPRPIERLENPDVYVPLTSRKELVNQYGYPLLASIDHALLFEPEARYRNADDWLKAMEGIPGFQTNQPIPLPIVQPAAPVGASIHVQQDSIRVQEEKKRLPLWLYILLALLLVLAGLLFWYLSSATTVHPPVHTPAPLVEPPLPPEPEPESTPQRPEPSQQPESTTKHEIEATQPKASNVPTPIAAIELPKKEPEPQPAQDDSQRRLIARPGARLFTPSGVEETTHFAVYYILNEDRDSYTVTSKYGSQKAEGTMRKSEVYVWPNNLTMKYKFGSEHYRRQSLYFNSPEMAKKYVMLERSDRDKILTSVLSAFDTYKDNREVAEKALGDIEREYGIIAIEPKRKGGQYLMPVLDYMHEHESNTPSEVKYGSCNKPTGIVRIAAMTTKKVEMPVSVPIKGETAYTPPVEVIFVIDTTKSMSPYIEGVRRSINNIAKKFVQSADEQKGRRVHFGLVGYRDWKATDKRGNGYDEAFEKKIGYLTKTYPDKDKPLLDIEEFKQVLNAEDPTEKGLKEIRETPVDSIDCHEDLAAGLYAAHEMHREKDAIRIYILIGDAPGREDTPSATCEADGRETNELFLASKVWQYRAKGSHTQKSLAQIKHILESGSAPSFIESYFIRAERYNGIKLKSWQAYIAKGEKQFRDLCYKNEATGEENFHIFEGKRFTDDVNSLDQIKDNGLWNEQVEEFTAVLQKSLERIIDVSDNPGIAEGNTEGKNSAIDMIFQEAYVNWLSQQTPNGEEPPMDMTGWTMDTTEASVVLQNKSIHVAPMEKCVVLSRSQFNKLYEKLTHVVKEFSTGEDDGYSEGDDNYNKLFTELVNVMLGVMKDPEHEFSGEISEATLNRALQNIPYKSQLITRIHEFIKGGTGIKDLDDNQKQNIWTDLKNKLNGLEEYAKGDNMWLQDALDKDNRNKDFIIIPTSMLP